MYRNRNNTYTAQYNEPVVKTLSKEDWVPRGYKPDYEKNKKRRAMQSSPHEWSSRKPGARGPFKGPSHRPPDLATDYWNQIMTGETSLEVVRPRK